MSELPSTLAGAYRLQPGQRPAITGQRPVIEGGRLAALLQGLPASAAPAACAAVFTLCAQAHRRVCAAAVAAAQDRPGPGDDSAWLHFEAAREHLRALALDWPARAGATPDLDWLRESPLRLAGAGPADAAAARAALRSWAGWFQRQVLQRPARDWLRECSQPEGLRAWCAEHALPPARLLLAWHAQAHALRPAGSALRVLDADAGQQQAQLRQLAGALAADPAFAQYPTWRGAPRENGPWSRHRMIAPPASAWMRLAARWIELAEFAAAADSATALLESGALPLAPGEAIAWCEMARGLLFHWVRLDGAGRVRDYRVLAPTEWNFHPEGALAQAVAALQPDGAGAATVLAAAYDPCVPCTVASGR